MWIRKSSPKHSMIVGLLVTSVFSMRRMTVHVVAPLPPDGAKHGSSTRAAPAVEAPNANAASAQTVAASPTLLTLLSSPRGEVSLSHRSTALSRAQTPASTGSGG